MANKLTLRTLGSVLAMAVLFLVLSGSLYLLATMAVRLDRFGQYYHWLLFFNGAAVVLLTALIGYNSWRLLREFRARVAGSRLTVKMVFVCTLLTLVPVLIVFSFSVKFLDSNIDSWFDVEIEQALDDALELSRESLGLQMRTLQRVTVEAAEHLIGVSEEDAILVLNEFGINTEASEMTLIGPDNRIIASTGTGSRISVQPNRPDNDLATRARRGLTYVGVDPIADGQLYIRIVTPVFSDSATRENSVLQALYPVAERASLLAESVQSSYQDYRQLVFLRKPLKISSILTLSLALLLSAMIGIWFAFYAARRMMVPIHDLVQGTRAVADGDYSRRVYKRGRDELGYLVQSFNYMTMQLERSRRTAEQNQQEIERQRAYLQAVLAQISSAVITLDSEYKVRTTNKAAEDMLGEQIRAYEGYSLQQAVQAGGVLGQFAEQLCEQLASDKTCASADKNFNDNMPAASQWSSEMDVYGRSGKLVLFCRGATLVDNESRVVGQVIAIDDMTMIIGAQRDAAWGEVARRLAHEIKNPLTPIRLSAERLRMKMLSKLSVADGELVKRLTETIENQVDAMKAMVNAFAEYAAVPRLEMTETDINALLAEVALLYDTADVEISLDLAESTPLLPLDAPRIRQLVHNLISNSLEAQLGAESRKVTLGTRVEFNSGTPQLELLAFDSGPGFPAEMIDRLFEPYVTSKPRGTGLGLAIVKKIVEEHGGSVVAENRLVSAVGDTPGARIRILLPMQMGSAVAVAGVDAA